MSNDEIEYSLSSKTYTLNGADLSGSKFPISLFVSKTSGSISAIPPLLISPLWQIIPLNQQTARLPYVIVNLLTGVVLGYLAFTLFKSKYLAYLSSFLFLFNPWSFFLSRFAADASFALFFYLLGIIFLLKFRNWKMYLSLVFFTLGFFSYNGAKIILFPIIIICLVYRLMMGHNFNLKKSRPEIIFLLFTTVFLITFFLINKSLPTSIVSDRMREIVFFDKEGISKNVNLFRNQQIISPLSNLFVNKFTEIMRIFIYNYFYVFSPVALFLTGDPRVIYSFYYSGLFYVFDLPLIIAGFIFLWQKNRKLFLFLLSLVIISPIPTAISRNDQSIVNRSFLLLPLLIMVLSYGIYSIYQNLDKKYFKNLFVVCLGICMVLGFMNFMFLYFFRLPVLAQENYATSQRVLAKLIVSEEIGKNHKTVVIGQQPRDNYLHTVFYAPNDLQAQLLKGNTVSSTSHNYSIHNVLFTRDCPTNFSKDSTYIIESAYKCDVFKKQKTSNHIIDQKDAGPIFDIYNSIFCQGIALTGWNNTHKLSDYAIEGMDHKTFCERWISI